MSKQPGELIAGRYRIEERLGEGATGVVYRALQVALGREVALKILHPRFALDEGARGRFEREARVASALDHPAAVAIHDFGDDGGTIFLAMELLPGRTLRDRLAEPEPPSVGEALRIGASVAEVLAVAHRIPLVHRDLKPENVFVEPSGTIRVLDFGLAFIAGRGREGRMTVEGVVTGTPEYLSPEQARGAAVGPPTDVYALGCMLHELLSGRVPFDGSDVEILTRQMFAPPPPLAPRSPAHPIPTALDRLVRGMLEKSSDARPTAEEVDAELRALDPEARERARDDRYLLGRAQRMVDAPARDEARADAPDALEVAILGNADADLVVALSAAGLVPYSADGPREAAGAAAIYAPGASPGAVTELARDGTPVVTDASPGDVSRLAALAAAGAAEVVPLPAVPAEIVRRVRRAMKRAKRTGSG